MLKGDSNTVGTAARSDCNNVTCGDSNAVRNAAI
jgi:hypothetical protein